MSEPQGNDRAMPEQAKVMQMICGYWLTQALNVAAKLRLPDLIAAGTRHVDELASTTGTNPHALFRLLRALESLGMLATSPDGGYQVTELGEYLRSDVPNSMRNLAILSGAEHYRIWSHLLDSVTSGTPSLELALGAPLFSYLHDHADAAERFNNAMSDLARNVHLPAVAALELHSAATVVDVGGGTGSLLAHVLATSPHLHGVLFDLPHVVAKAQPVLEAAGVLDRCQLVGGDFFEEPVPGDGDIYLLSLVLHDFGDAPAERILKKVRSSIPDHARLVVLEQVVPEHGQPHISKLVDLNMLVISGGRERTEKEFESLLKSAGFELQRVLPSPTTLNAIVALPRT